MTSSTGPSGRARRRARASAAAPAGRGGRSPAAAGCRRRGVRSAPADAVNTCGQPGAEPVGDARPRVGLVHDDRDLAPAGGEVGRQRDVTTEADDDVGPTSRSTASTALRPRAAARTQQRRVDLAWKRYRRDQLECGSHVRGSAGCRGPGRFRAPSPSRRGPAAGSRRPGQRRLDVTGRMPAGEPLPTASIMRGYGHRYAGDPRCRSRDAVVAGGGRHCPTGTAAPVDERAAEKKRTEDAAHAGGRPDRNARLRAMKTRAGPAATGPRAARLGAT